MNLTCFVDKRFSFYLSVYSQLSYFEGKGFLPGNMCHYPQYVLYLVYASFRQLED